MNRPVPDDVESVLVVVAKCDAYGRPIPDEFVTVGSIPMTDTPLSDDVVERVARALALDFDVDPDVAIGMHGRDKWEKQWHTAARAALEAARYGDAIEALTDIHRRVLCPVGPSPTIDDLGKIASKALESINGR